MQWFDYAVLYVLPAAESKAAIENLFQVRYGLRSHYSAIFIFEIKITELFSRIDTQELNEYLSQRSYLVGQSYTLADVVVFYALSDIMVCTSFRYQRGRLMWNYHI